MTGQVRRGNIPREVLFRFIVAKSLQTANAGLLLGAVAGWLGLLSGGTADAIASASVRVYLFMALALPVALVLTTMSDVRRALPRSADRATAARVCLALLGIVAGATLLGTAYFLVVTFYLPTVFSAFKLDPIAIREAVLSQFDWAVVGVVFGATTLVGLLKIGLTRMGGAQKGR
jgi:hypothetical protein